MRGATPAREPDGVADGVGAETSADLGADPGITRAGVADGSVGVPPRRPMVTCTYATPSGADGHAILTQLPRLRAIGTAAPRATWPITGVTVLGPLCTSAEGAVTVKTGVCA